MKSQALVLLATLFSTATCIEKSPPRLMGKASKMNPEDFPWTDPFKSAEIGNFAPACEAKRSFRASEFLLDDLSLPPPKGLQPYSSVLKNALKGRPYPGSWDGIDAQGYDPHLIQMDYVDVPPRVRGWIERQELEETSEDGLFSVFERKLKDEKADGTAKPPESRKPGDADPEDENKVVLFAPGAIYHALPLWVAEGSDCEGEIPSKLDRKCTELLTYFAAALLDTSKYTSTPADGAVIAWTTEHSKAVRRKGREMEFTITAQVLKQAEGAAKETPTQTTPLESTKEEL